MVVRDKLEVKKVDNCLLIFFKNPEAGKVKTRLARKIGHEKAAKLYRLFVEAIIMRTFDKEGYYERLLFYTPVERKSEIKSWIVGAYCNTPLLLYPQIGSDLGERMFNALKTAHSSGAKKAVIIGTDSPTVDREIICKAFCLLKENDVVIGPTVDGGYYLIGMSLRAKRSRAKGRFAVANNLSLSALRRFFTGIDWGTNNVFEQTFRKIRNENASCVVLDLHYDVDNLEDLKTLKQEILLMDVNKRCGLLDIYKTIENDLNI